MGKYDSSRATTVADVKKEVVEAGKEIVEAAVAVKALGADSEVAQKEVQQGLVATTEAVEAVADLVADQVVELAERGLRFFKNKLGYTLHDPDQNKTLSPAKVTPAALTPWMEAQLKKGWVAEVSAGEAEDELRGPLLRDELA